MSNIDFDSLDDQVYALLFEKAQAGTLSDTALTKLAQMAQAREERRRIEAEQAVKEREPTLLEIIDLPTLPVRKKMELLMARAVELRAELNAVEEALGRLGGD